MTNKQTDIQYAIDNTEILYEPDRRISTFGDTRFEFVLLTEPMDSVGVTCVRYGWIEAERPKIIRPDAYSTIEVEGFSPEGTRFIEWMMSQGYLKALVQYGFQFRRSEVSEEILHEPLEAVQGRLLEEFRLKGDPLKTIVKGIDDTWEICLLQFTLEMVKKSHDINLFDFKRKGLL